MLAGLLRGVLRQAAPRGVGHLLHGNAHILAKRADATGDFLDVQVHGLLLWCVGGATGRLRADRCGRGGRRAPFGLF